jgi:hypothetical protein
VHPAGTVVTVLTVKATPPLVSAGHVAPAAGESVQEEGQAALFPLSG